MPLDDSGFGSLPNYQAMLIVPQEIMEHVQHQGCMKKLWIGVGRKLLAEKLNINLPQVYITTALEVTTGHLMAHRGKICVLGVDINSTTVNFLSTNADFENLMPIKSYWMPTDGMNICEFPKTVGRLISEGQEFNAAIVHTPSTLLFCEVDIEQSQAIDQVALHYPIDMWEGLHMSLIPRIG